MSEWLGEWISVPAEKPLPSIARHSDHTSYSYSITGSSDSSLFGRAYFATMAAAEKFTDMLRSRGLCVAEIPQPKGYKVMWEPWYNAHE